MDREIETIPVSVFKQKCLRIIEEVAHTHQAVIISKRGKPVARLVPMQSAREIEDSILSELRNGQGGTLVDEATFLEPTSTIVEWHTH